MADPASRVSVEWLEAYSISENVSWYRIPPAVRASPTGPDLAGWLIAETKRVLHLIGTILIGFLAGVVAKLLTPGRDPGGFIVTTILGIIGAFVATYLGQAVGWYRAYEGAGFIGAVVGAIILLAIYHFIQRRSAAGGRY